MATREENLAKINSELEKLRDDELDKVAGGAWHHLLAQSDKVTVKANQQDNQAGVNKALVRAI